MFGFLNVYKPKGKTSHDVVGILRRITKIKQIGHTGTLDPFAEGVLPICIGKATRLIEYLDDDKAYIGTVQLGNSTTTYDLEGETVNISQKNVSLNEIEDILNLFRGDIEQVPPIYSAIKVDGKKLYEYARKGEKVDIKPRIVNVKKLSILNYDPDQKQLELYIECSKGTYIRSIANDLGEKLGTYGHLIKLVRVKAGDFLVENSTKLEEFDSIEKVKSKLIEPLEILNYKRYNLNSDEYERISHGNSIKIHAGDANVLLIYQNSLVAIGTSEKGLVKCKKVFI